MFLQILPPDNVATAQSIFESQLVPVLLGLAVSVFVIIRIAKFLSKIKVNRKPSYTSRTA
ncbi:hypothetical protein [Polaribacter sp. Hel1_85]|uniref:hypothetical protein n=1 Tax=Polaribacter sp. Hel1_85 TaxID=1250005 RepID=UPI00052C2061|nr:hypothetical protein [Polaribacter sp. Hel1_85]KGL62171.1 hypothetical protein PHEL85_1959 [Polaribacter sp. Hel1_85]